MLGVNDPNCVVFCNGDKSLDARLTIGIVGEAVFDKKQASWLDTKPGNVCKNILKNSVQADHLEDLYFSPAVKAKLKTKFKKAHRADYDVVRQLLLGAYMTCRIRDQLQFSIAAGTIDAQHRGSPPHFLSCTLLSHLPHSMQHIHTRYQPPVSYYHVNLKC